ncbi:serine/threonine protein kinase, partial [Myxococcota bacterium]|nr:serine/threonine protein kinase [Myxococcota bacterium]
MAHHSKPAAIFIVHGPGIDPGPLVQGLASRGVSVRAGSAGDLPAEPKEKILWLVSTKEDLDRLACREKSSVASPCFVLMEPSLRSLFNEPSPGAYEIMPLPDTEADIKALADVLTRDGETGPAHTATLAVSHAPEAYGETMDSDSSGGAEISPPSEEHNTLPPQDSLSGAFDETVASDSGRGSQGGATNRAQTSGSILDSDADTLPEGSRVENWTIGPLLGKGGMGAVYRAYDPDLKRDIALKILSSGSPTAVERFRTEAVAVARIKNPGVATVHRTGLFRGHNYIAMELVDGMDLDRFVTKNRPPLRKRVALLEQVASVIREAHTKGVIHRDLKPANIMVQPDETVKVLDFGLAKMREDESDRVKVTADNAILGTPAYMAPEQAASRHDEVDTRTDVYALGTILYELIAGERPFKEKSLVGLIHALVYEEPTPLRAHGIKDHDLEAIVNTCLEKRPHDRYQSVGLFMADLARWQRGDEVMVRPRSILARSWALLKRHYVIAAALLLGVLLTAGLLTYREIDKRRRVRTLLAQSQQNIQRVEVLARAVKEFLFLSRTDKS